MFCPNLSDPEVRRDFNKIADVVGNKIAYQVWNLNNGNPIHLNKNGEQSVLYENLLIQYNGNHRAAIKAKSKMYSISMQKSIVNKVFELDTQGEIKLKDLLEFHYETEKRPLQETKYEPDERYDKNLKDLGSRRQYEEYKQVSKELSGEEDRNNFRNFLAEKIHIVAAIDRAEDFAEINPDNYDKYKERLEKKLDYINFDIESTNAQIGNLKVNHPNRPKLAKKANILNEYRKYIETQLVKLNEIKSNDPILYLDLFNESILRTYNTILNINKTKKIGDPYVLQDAIYDIQFINMYVDQLAELYTGENDKVADEQTQRVIETLKANIEKLNKLTVNLGRTLTEQLIIEDPNIQQNFFHGMTEEEMQNAAEKLIMDIFDDNQGTNSTFDYFSGSMSTFKKDLPHTQVILKYLYKELKARTSQINAYKERIDDIAKKIGNKYRDEVFLERKNGELTGKLIDYFNADWKELTNKFRRISRYNDTVENIYMKKLAWLKEYGQVLDFRRIREIRNYKLKDVDGNETGETFLEYASRMGYGYLTSKEYSDEFNIPYEEKLKEELGIMYDHYIQKAISKLQNYYNYQQELMSSYGTVEFEVGLKQNPLDFLTKQFDSNGKVNDKVIIYNLKFDDGTSKTVASNMDNVVILPRDIKKYKNEDFENLTPEEIELWSILRDVLSNYINPVFNDAHDDDLSLPKFMQGFLETIKGNGLKKATERSIAGIKSSFFISDLREGNFSVLKSYTDNTEAQFHNISETLSMMNDDQIDEQAEKYKVDTSLEREEKIFKIASRIVYEPYSKQVLKSVGTLLDLTANQIARENTAPLAWALLQHHKSIADPTSVSSQKIENHVKKRVLGQATSGGRKGNERLSNAKLGKNKDGSANLLQRTLTQSGKIPILGKVLNEYTLKNLSEADRALIEIFKELQKTDGFENTMSFFDYDKDVQVKYEYNEKSESYYRWVAVDGHFDYQNKEEITFEEFEKALTDYVNKKIHEMGVDMTVAGFTNGILSALIFKGLGWSPRAGIFNRLEGKLSAYKMDATGHYWKEGNYVAASNFLFGANSRRVYQRLANLYGTESLKFRNSQLNIFSEFFKATNLLQDKKSELDRNVDITRKKYEKWGEMLDPYEWAVNLPEWKTQLAVGLAVLMDFKIIDKYGNEHFIFDKDKMEFTAHEIDINGNLRLKEDFRTPENINNWEEFSNDIDIKDSFDVFSNKATWCISRTNGNYSDLDTNLAVSNTLVRPFMLFRRWMPEHMMNRYATGEGINLMTGQKNVKGNFLTALESPEIALTLGAVNAITSSLNPIVILGNLGMLGYGVIHSLRRISKNVEGEVRSFGPMLRVLGQVLIETFNAFPMFFSRKMRFKTQLLDGVVNQRSIFNYKFTEEDVGNLKYLSREMGTKVALISVLFTMKAFLMGLIKGDDDDDKNKYMTNEQKELMKMYNFVQNQGAKLSDTFFKFSNPIFEFKDFVTGGSLRNANDFYDLSMSLLEGDYRYLSDSKKIQRLSPFPRFFYTENVFKYNIPFAGSLEFWKDEKMFTKDMSVFDKKIYGRESMKKQFYSDLRVMVADDILENIKRGKEIPKSFKNIKKTDSDEEMLAEIRKVLPRKGKKYGTYDELVDELFEISKENGNNYRFMKLDWMSINF